MRKLLELVMKLSDKGLHVFLQYSPHATWITLQIYNGRWSTGDGAWMWVDLNDAYQINKAINFLEYLEELW